MKKEFTITVFTENQTGLLSRVVSVFTRRHINIESLTTSKSSIPGIHRFTIVVVVEEEMVRKLVAQLEKQVDVVKAFYYHEDEIVYQEIALYKVPTSAFSNGNRIERLIRKHNARILEVEPEYIVIEKTGHQFETEALLEELKAIGIYEFVRSGRIAIVKPMERLNQYLQSLPAASGR
ncbi:MAG: acetolactate synthase small subunit [Bacteroidetes bacterium]|nr:MAG: acetolactate synthase small subunit [Bacteroidota bacterium]